MIIYMGDKWVPTDPVDGWKTNVEGYTASHLKPLDEGSATVWKDLFKKKEARSFLLEPDSADSQCNESGCGTKPTGSHNQKICYICGFNINNPGNSATDTISQCLSKDGDAKNKLDDWVLGDGENMKAYKEIWYHPIPGKRKKMKKLEPFTGFGQGGNVKTCGREKPPVWADEQCNKNDGQPCRKNKTNRLFRKNVTATPCGSQCEHILPIVTLAFVCGLKLPDFEKALKDIFSCEYPKLKNYESSFTEWRNTLYGLKRNPDYPAQNSKQPETKPGVVYLWAHPYCNQFKNVYPFLDVNFDLNNGIELNVNENNIKYILQTLGGYFISDREKNLVTRKNWWDSDCVDQKNDGGSTLKNDDGSTLTKEWYDARLKALTEQMENLKRNIDHKNLKIFVSICIQAVRIIIKKKVRNLVGITKLNLCDSITKLLRNSDIVLSQGGGGPDKYLKGGSNIEVKIDNSEVSELLNPDICIEPKKINEYDKSETIEKIKGNEDLKIELFRQILDKIRFSKMMGGGGKRNRDIIEMNEITTLFYNEIKSNPILKSRLECDLSLAQVFEDDDNMDEGEDEGEDDDNMDEGEDTDGSTPRIIRRFRRPSSMNDMQTGGGNSFICSYCERSFNESERVNKLLDIEMSETKLRNSRRVIYKSDYSPVCRECSRLIDEGDENIKDNRLIQSDDNTYLPMHEFIRDSIGYDLDILKQDILQQDELETGKRARGSVPYKKKKSTKKRKPKRKRKYKRRPCKTIRECKKKLTGVKKRIKNLTKKKKKKRSKK